MRSIVVYKFIIVIGIWVLATEVRAQKPAIDLISSHQQYRHPEAIIDTAFALNSPVADSLRFQAPPVPKQEPEAAKKKKHHRQIGPSLDSIFQNRDNKNRSGEKYPVKNSLFGKKYNPIKIFLNIIALN